VAFNWSLPTRRAAIDLGIKTTIEIPEDLYKKTKIRAIECGLTLKQIILKSLERELQVSPLPQEPVTSYWTNRKLLPEFAAAQQSGVYRPKPADRDITDRISEDRYFDDNLKFL
jgi:hypothetical protein